MKTLDLIEMEKQLQALFGQRFFQFAFYVDNRKLKRIGKYWLKVESELADGEYRAWQVRDKNSLVEAWDEIIKKIRSDLTKK